MSASREKKQRQGTGPSARDVQTQQQTAAYKKKVRLYTVIGIVVVVLVAALLTWNSGIFQRNQTAATVGSTNYSVNDVNYYYQAARYESFMWYYYMGSTPPSDETVMDSDSGKTYREYFLEQALDKLTRTTALYDDAIKNGYSEKDVADDVDEQIKSAKESASSNGYSYGAFLKAQYGRYMTPSAFKSILTKDILATTYYNDHAKSLTYSDGDLQAYYDENKDSLDTFEYSYLYFTPADVVTTDEDGNDLELSEEKKAELEKQALADAKAKAEKALAAVKSGSEIAGLIEQYELTASTSGDHTATVGSNVSSAYRDQLFSLKDGESALVENGESGYYVIVLHERKLVEDPTADVRHILVRAETTTGEDDSIVAPTDEAWAAAQEKAEKILAEYQAGEQTEEAFAALADKYSDDAGSEGGLYEGIAENSSYVPEFLGWIFDTQHQPGDTGIIRHEGDISSSGSYWGCHVMYYVGAANPVWMNTAESALRSADAAEWRDGLESGYTAALTSAADHVAN